MWDFFRYNLYYGYRGLNIRLNVFFIIIGNNISCIFIFFIIICDEVNLLFFVWIVIIFKVVGRNIIKYGFINGKFEVIEFIFRK